MTVRRVRSAAFARTNGGTAREIRMARAVRCRGKATRDLVKLLHSYQAAKPFSGTDEAIS